MGTKELQTYFQTLLWLLMAKQGWSETKRVERSTPVYPCSSGGVEWVRSTDDCSKYVVCGYGEPVATMVCPNYLHWSVRVNTCVARGSRYDDCTGAAERDFHAHPTDSPRRRHQRGHHEQTHQQHDRGRRWRTGRKGAAREKTRKDMAGSESGGDTVTQWKVRTPVTGRVSKVQQGGTGSTQNDITTTTLTYTAAPSSTFPPQTDSPSWTDVSTPSRPRWRWIEWDFTRGSRDDYPTHTSVDVSTSSLPYPSQGHTSNTPQQDPTQTYTEYPQTDRPGDDYYDTLNTDSQDYVQATARWLRTTPPIKQTEAGTEATTSKSPFARFATTRRRPEGRNGNHNRIKTPSWPKHRSEQTVDDDKESEDNGVDDWLRKSPWWRTWAPRWSSNPMSSTAPPWWARDGVLPWLTPSSVWVPESPGTTTTEATTTPPPTTTTAAVMTETVEASTIGTESTTAWTYDSTTGNSREPDWLSTTGESLLPTTTTDLWKLPRHRHEGDEANEEWVSWTTGEGRKTSSTPAQSTTVPQVSQDQLTLEGHNNTPAYHPECGVAVTNMIVGGLPASEGRWPWVVSLRLTWARRHVCGGTLVHPQWIVTAAHCVYGSQFEKASDWRAVFGNVQATLTSDVKQQLPIDLIVRHPEFVNGGNYPNDVAMVRLHKPVDVTGFRVRHACLPSRDQPFLSNSECWIMGWGETKGFEEQSVLQELVVKIRRNQACAARWGWKRILNSHVCVGNGDGGACNGDSGGPLVCLRDGYYFLAGVTSWGVSGCQTTGYPSVFTRVSFYEKWIESVIQTYSTIDFALTP